MDQRSAQSFMLAKLKAELPAARTYHSYDHTVDVLRATEVIAEQEGIAGVELDLLRTAATYHDSGFIIGDLDHEEMSCSMARQFLPDFGYNTAQVDFVCDMIMATRIPQSPRNKLSRILCDADLDYLGRSDFFRIGDGLFEELKSYGVLTTEREWNEIQLRFLSKHRYFTPTNKRVREPVKQENIAQVQMWLAKAS